MTSLQPLGDQAALAHFASEADALHFSAVIRQQNPRWLIDVVQAYASVAVFFDFDQTNYQQVAEYLHSLRRDLLKEQVEVATPGRTHHIPCCYELGVDLQRVAGHTGLSVEQVMELHLSTPYTVYAIGFCPGFPYLGYLPDQLSGVPRLESPRKRVEAGSVGLTGKQTGIYTEIRPGGWNIVGRTPLQLVDVADGYFPLRTGDQVSFERIDETEYVRLKGQRL